MPVTGTPVTTATVNIAQAKITQVYGQSINTKLLAINVVQGQIVTIQWVMRDVVGNPIDLTNVMGASLTLRCSEATATTQNPTFTDMTGMILDAPSGLVSATLTSDIVAFAGISWAEFALLDTDSNVIYSNKFYLVVEFGQFSRQSQIARQGPPSLSEIRLHLRDNAPEDNYLLDTVEFDMAEIAACITRPIDQFNGMPPPINTIYNTVNFPNRYYWLEGIIANLLTLAAANYRRNQLAYSAGGLSIDDKNKEKQYLEAAMLHKKNWEDWAKMKKIQLNMDAGFGSILSSYTSYAGPWGY